MESSPSQLRSAGTARLLLLWCLAIAVAFAFDGTITRSILSASLKFKGSSLAERLKTPGDFGFVLLVALFVWILHPTRLRGAIFLCLGSILAGGMYALLKWPVGRIRPIVFINPWHFEPFRGGLRGFIHLENAAFPSGHACLAFAWAAGMAYLLPRGRWAFYAVAAAVGVERVMELAHYPSDVVAGAGLGLLASRLVLKWVGPGWITSEAIIGEKSPPAGRQSPPTMDAPADHR